MSFRGMTLKNYLYDNVCQTHQIHSYDFTILHTVQVHECCADIDLGTLLSYEHLTAVNWQR